MFRSQTACRRLDSAVRVDRREGIVLSHSRPSRSFAIGAVPLEVQSNKFTSIATIREQRLVAKWPTMRRA
jgi:hypothetical protein